MAVTGPLVRLGSELRARGVRVGTGELVTAHRALLALPEPDRRASRLALRAVLCAKREDMPAFEAAFEAAFDVRGDVPAPNIDPVATAVLPRTAIPSDAPPEIGGVEEIEIRPAAFSEQELLGAKDFAEYSDSERRVARSVLRELARHGPQRIGRRLRADRRHGERPDLRATLRRSLRHGGEPIERRRSARRPQQRPLVLVLDVSGSMDSYARMLLQYAQACAASRRRTEVFAFSTRLTRITQELRGRDPDAAIARAAALGEDWSGGTRIGESIAELNRVHGRRIGRGAVVVILSDGWERGDPDDLGRELARLGRCSHRLIWLNPLKAAPGYEPLARGMAAALPHLDAFLAGNSLDSLAELAALMRTEM
ncbi:VWA domain-containing protein [Thermoleophilia bacterium SCSIO 60948]|nr:VWA domain-containing protein [Thermoleophilia bacterium SCSIO 60948]